MTSLLKWIWSALRWVGNKVGQVFAAIWNVLSSAITWVVATVTYILDSIWDWVSDGLDSFLDEITSFVDLGSTSFPNISTDLTRHLCGVFALDDAIEWAFVLLSAFVVARLLRLAMVPIRALLEVL